MINNLKESPNKWKIYLSIKIILRSPKDNGEGREMFLLSENILVMVGEMNVIFRSFLANYHENLIVKKRANCFTFDYVKRLYYGCHKITLNLNGPYIAGTNVAYKRLVKLTRLWCFLCSL